MARQHANHWQTTAPFAGLADACLLRSAQGFLCGASGPLFHAQQLPPGLAVQAEQNLGRFNTKTVSLLLCQGGEASGCSWQTLRSLMQQADGATLHMLCVAEQVVHWQMQHQFCGRCGAKSAQVAGQRCMRCPSCGLENYPRLSPSMIVLVTRGDEILLARSPRFVSGMYSTLAGFVEPGESAEQCVVREVREEVALEINRLRYQGSQSWPFPHSLMLGFHAEYLSGAIKCQEDEIEDAQWFSIHRLPRLPMPQSIARQLIDSYLKQRLNPDNG